jgi:predicted RecA/RadA family phage recombinase
MKNFVAPGQTIQHTPAAARAAGAATLIGTRIGVAMSDVAISTEGTFAIKGVYTLPKLSTDVVTQGAALYWDNTNLRLTLTSAGNTICGWAYEAAGNGVTSVACVINEV